MARGRKLNVPLIKSVVMFALGIGVGVGEAVTGIGAQVAVGPMLIFLLGFAAEKAGGTALVFSLFGAAAGAFGAHRAGVPIHVVDALILALGAVIGAILTAGPAADPRAQNSLKRARRVGHSLVMLLGVYVLSAVLRPRFGGLSAPLPFLQTTGGLFVVGLVCGALSQLFQISSGVLLVPALVLLTGRAPAEAIAMSLIVAAAAAVLPAITYTTRGLVDSRFGPWMALGGALGGLAGGLLLGYLARESGITASLPIVAFSLVAMYLSAWALWKST